ncbi:MAG: phenylalanine--tRNA ligase subunit beta [Clostridia bacterium]|nr:phenylalanine--tRNA ligase subunit beta [Clostridia bacterium]
MKLSTNFLKDYVDIDVDVKTLAEDMTRVGNEYDEAEKLIKATKLVIGKVISCKEHPDSDHLHICKVDVGTEVLDIVCGAPNVREGLKVIVALVGAQLPGGEIKKGVIRGETSNGMICSIAELGLDNKFLKEEDKAGIHELPEDAPVGEDPIKYMKLDDEVIDFELTANRGDLLSILGMAYEVGAIYDKPVKEVETKYTESKENVENEFSIDIQTENCKLFLAKKVKNVTIKQSPDFIKNRLIASGIRPINNVVDISNYVMLELGQPLHFYDADRLGNKIVVRMAKEGEKLTTLDGIERDLNSSDITIANNNEAIGLAGVMGGLDTEVESDTKNIVIESAIFDNVKVRMTSNKILRSEASNRFEKGLDPKRTYMAMERACYLLEKYADAEIMLGMCVYDKTDKTEKVIEIEFQNINDVLGTNILKEDILNVFRRLGFKATSDDVKAIVTVPTRRLDISIKEDLIEEVSRIYGVDNIQGKLPILPIRPGKIDKTYREIRNKMISLGLNETLSYILINDKEIHKYTLDEFEELKLLAPITEDRNTLRYSVIPSMVKIYEYNKARDIKDISIFEIGKGFYKKQEEYGENTKLCALMTGDYYNELGNTKQVDFYVIKGVAEEILDYLGYENRYSFVKKEQIPEEFHPGQTAYISVNNDIVGIIGRLHPNIENNVNNAKSPVYVLEINLDKLLEKKTGKMKFKEISKFPSIEKDVAFVVDKNITSLEIETNIKKAAGSMLEIIKPFDLYVGEQLGDNKKSIAYSLTFSDSKRTLTEEVVLESMQKVIDTVCKKCGAECRK